MQIKTELISLNMSFLRASDMGGCVYLVPLLLRYKSRTVMILITKMRFNLGCI